MFTIATGAGTSVNMALYVARILVGVGSSSHKQNSLNIEPNLSRWVCSIPWMRFSRWHGCDWQMRGWMCFRHLGHPCRGLVSVGLDVVQGERWCFVLALSKHLQGNIYCHTVDTDLQAGLQYEELLLQNDYEAGNILWLINQPRLTYPAQKYGLSKSL